MSKVVAAHPSTPCKVVASLSNTGVENKTLLWIAVSQCLEDLKSHGTGVTLPRSQSPTLSLDLSTRVLVALIAKVRHHHAV
jgi:hypothetical protein